MQTIYLNHAGTSWPKPAPVVAATASLLQSDPADWPEIFATAHQTVAEFFHIAPARLLLTPSCTSALQLAVQDHAWRPGDRVLTSHFEHHALHRSLVKLEELGVTVSTLPYRNREPILLDALEAELKRGSVKLLALTAACNVTGQLLPIAEAISLAHQFGALVLIDGAQISGWWDLDVAALQADLFTFAGHKGPQAPWGVGGLYVSPDLPMQCPAAVCDLTASRSHPDVSVMPGYCDAGSVNLAALSGLAAACQWLAAPAQQDRLRTARQLAAAFTESVRQLPRVTVQHDTRLESKVPTVAISVAQTASADLADQLRGQGLIVSAGLQCAPQAHLALGTADSGVLRFSFGPTNQRSDVHTAVEVLQELLE